MTSDPQRKKIAVLIVGLGIALVVSGSLLYAINNNIQSSPSSSNTSPPPSTTSPQASDKRPKNTEAAPAPKGTPISVKPPERSGLSYSECEKLVASGATSIPPECQSAYNVYQQKLQYERERAERLRQQQARDAERAEQARQYEQRMQEYRERLKQNDYLKPPPSNPNRQDYLKKTANQNPSQNNDWLRRP